MADYYVYSGATGSNDGSSWANAWTSLVSATGVAAGSTVLVASDHNHNLTGTVTFQFASTIGNPVRILSVNRTSGLIEAGARMWAQDVTTVYHIRGSIYVNGLEIEFTTSGGAYNSAVNIANGSATDVQSWESCRLLANAKGASARIIVGTSNNIGPADVVFRDCEFDQLRSSIQIVNASARIYGGKLGANFGSYIDEGVFYLSSTGEGHRVVLDGFDMSSAPAGANILSSEVKQAGLVQFFNCKMPAAWSGVIQNVPAVSSVIEMYGCTNGTQTYRMRRSYCMGTLRDETSVVRTGGASDGTTPLSWAMTTNGNAGEYVMALPSGPIQLWNSSTGSSKTATIEIVHDSATALTDAEVWLELSYMGTAGQTITTVARDKRATPLTTPAAQTSSTATWSGTSGFGTVQKQKLEVAFTPEIVGPVTATVYLAAPSKTIYVCPKLEIA